jgi:hypothetical protein
VMALIAAATIATVFVSHEIYNLEKLLKKQEKRIDDLNALLVDTKNSSNLQIQNLNFRLKDEVEERRIQINKLLLNDDAFYTGLIKSLQADTRQINYLDGYTKHLNDEIEKISTPDSQAKGLPNPTGWK